MPFAHSQILWMLLIFPPALVVFSWWAWRVRQQLLTQFIQVRLLAGLTVGISPAREKFRLGLIVAAVVFLILALARPQWGFDWEETKQRGLDIVVAVDTSKSMLAEDIAPNRLTRAKLAALELMQQAKSDRLGLVAFAGAAFLQCPLTVDETAFRQSVDALDTGIISEGGTALAEAIQTALTAFKEGDNYKTLVLLSDGEDHDSGALEAATKAGEAGLRIFTIGIGSAEGELLRVKDAKGRTDYIRDEKGDVVKSRLNDSLLREIASATHGFYLPMQGAKTIETLYREGLAPLPKSEGAEKLVKQFHERYHWPLAIAVTLLVLEMLLPERAREARARRSAAPTAKSPVPAVAAGVALLFAWATVARGSPSSALREYQAGKYEEALKEYERLLEKQKEDPRLHFNAGAAAYRDHKYDEAAKQFNEALNSTDLSLQARSYYNRGNSLFHLGEAVPDPKAKTGAWEKALKDYESARKLNAQDPDAAFNYEFVKRKLEELKQQQQQQQNSDKDQDQNQDQKKQDQNQQQDKQDKQDKQDQQQQQKKDQQQQDQASQDQKQSSSPEDQKQQQQQKQAPDKDQQQAAQDKKDSSGQKEQPDQQQQAQASSQAGDKSDEKADAEARAAEALGQMTPEQARQLLDAQKNDEKLLPAKPEHRANNTTKPVKDW